MAKKNATPSKEQVEILKRNGLNTLCWIVVQDLPNSMIVRHRVTGEFRMIDK